MCVSGEHETEKSREDHSWNRGLQVFLLNPITTTATTTNWTWSSKCTTHITFTYFFPIFSCYFEHIDVMNRDAKTRKLSWTIPKRSIYQPRVVRWWQQPILLPTLVSLRRPTGISTCILLLPLLPPPPPPLLLLLLLLPPLHSTHNLRSPSLPLPQDRQEPTFGCFPHGTVKGYSQDSHHAGRLVSVPRSLPPCCTHPCTCYTTYCRDISGVGPSATFNISRSAAPPSICNPSKKITFADSGVCSQSKLPWEVFGR
ncbi:hypothetical protein F4775DRAFT_425585 [Biscogniauxia sp. FL1348]|nr:hypothetical protein F4775DRAFT_425585 [Biscogniauxia sp. FL1348]